MGNPIIRNPTAGTFADGELVHHNDGANAAELLSNVDSSNVKHRASVRRAVMTRHISKESGDYHVGQSPDNQELGAFLVHRVVTSCTLLRFWFVKFGELLGSSSNEAQGTILESDAGGSATNKLLLKLYVVPQYEGAEVAASSSVSGFGTLSEYPNIINEPSSTSIYALEKKILVNNQAVTTTNVPYSIIFNPSSTTTKQQLNAGDLVVLQVIWYTSTSWPTPDKTFFGPMSAALYLQEEHV
jgi:hypothetical protein